MGLFPAKPASLVPLLLGLGLLVIAGLPAQAQLPPAAPLSKVDVQADEDTVTIEKVDGEAVINFRIRFTCLTAPDTYGPCTGAAAERTYDVTINFTPETPPDGWSAQVAPVSFSSMPAGEQRNVTARVQLTQEDPVKNDFTLSVRARAVARGDGSPLPDGLGQTTEDSDAVRVRKDLNLAETVIELANTYWIPLAIFGAAILVTAVVLSTRRKGKLALSCDAPQQTVMPGRGASFPIRLANESREDDRIRVTVGRLPAGWNSILPLDELEVKRDDETQLWLTVRSPARALTGEVVPIDLRAVSLRSSQRSASLSVEVRVEGEPPPEESPFPDEEALSASPASEPAVARKRRK